ncbi:MAG: creatininase family protein [Anaerolineae bacterium]
MQWEQLTAPDLGRAVQETGTCVLALGVLERHSDHLPLGTDFMNAHAIASLATQQEPAVVFPPFYWGQIYEARCFPGAITLRPTLLLDLIQSVLDEIGRNGFRKIVLYNGHGGNQRLVAFLAQCSLWEQKPYTLYVAEGGLSSERHAAWNAILETDQHGHACECETSITLANYPDLVQMDAVPEKPATPLGRAGGVPGAFCGASWYANYPEHYAGDARTASAEKGRALRRLLVEDLAAFISRVKADEVIPALEHEFFARERALRAGACDPTP